MNEESLDLAPSSAAGRGHWLGHPGRTMPTCTTVALVLALATCSPGADSADDRPLYDYLAAQGALGSYMKEIVAAVLGDLTDGSGRLNLPPASGAVNVYMVKPGLLDSSRLSELGIPEIGEAITLEESRVILVSEPHLQELVTLAVLHWERDVPMMVAVADTSLQGLAALRGLWDPTQNTALRSPEVQYWRIAFRGALAFVLAHEIAHVGMGQAPRPEIRTKRVFTSRRDRDIHWACPELVDSRASVQRDIEVRADQNAVRLLQTHSGGRSPGQYEVGSEWYFAVLLERSYIQALGHLHNLDAKPDLKRFLQDRFGARRLAALMEKSGTDGRGAGPVSFFYPRTHPSVLSRLSLSMDLDPEMATLTQAWADRLERECVSLRYQ